jgi:hypothetical protein
MLYNPPIDCLMSPREEKANAEALRRVHEAKETAAGALDLSDLDFLGQLPRDLMWLTLLKTLNFSGCEQLRGDLQPLARLTSLRTLQLTGCVGIRRFAPLESLLPILQDLRLFDCKFEDLPSEICGESSDENVLVKVRAHFEDLKAGQGPDVEVKVLAGGPPTQAGRVDEAPKSQLEITDSHQVPALKVFVSYAWGDTSSIAPPKKIASVKKWSNVCARHWKMSIGTCFAT